MVGEAAGHYYPQPQSQSQNVAELPKKEEKNGNSEN